MNKKAIALVIAGLIILAAIIYFIFFYDFSGNQNQPANQPPQTPAETVVSQSSGPTPTGTAQPRSEEEKSRDAANQLALYFTDRYGSSSNQADFSNLIDLKVFMTEALAARTDAYIAAERAKTGSVEKYEGVTTKSIIAEFVTFSEANGTAEGVVKTKRQATAADGKVTTYDQNLTIGLRKIDGQWKVDRAEWQK